MAAACALTHTCGGTPAVYAGPMTTPQRRYADPALPAFRPARSALPAIAAAEARQRHLRLVHTVAAQAASAKGGPLPGGRRFDDPQPRHAASSARLARRMKSLGLWLAVAASVTLLLAAG